MPKYIVSTGDIRNYIVTAEDIDEAFKEAIDAYPQALLGILCEVAEIGQPEEDWVYVDTEKKLRQLGYWENEEEVLTADTIE